MLGERGECHRRADRHELVGDLDLIQAGDAGHVDQTARADPPLAHIGQHVRAPGDDSRRAPVSLKVCEGLFN